MASRYFKLAFSTVGALGFGLVVAAIVMPESFSAFFTPDAAKTEAVSAALRAERAQTPPVRVDTVEQNTLTDDLPQTKDELDALAEALKATQEQQDAEISAVLRNAKKMVPETEEQANPGAVPKTETAPDETAKPASPAEETPQ